MFYSIFNYRPKDDEESAKLVKEDDVTALDKLKEILNPEDISFLRKKLSEERDRSQKSLSTDLDSLLNKTPVPREIVKRPRTILEKEEIELIKAKAGASSSSSSSLGKLELLLKGLL